MVDESEVGDFVDEERFKSVVEDRELMERLG